MPRPAFFAKLAYTMVASSAALLACTNDHNPNHATTGSTGSTSSGAGGMGGNSAMGFSVRGSVEQIDVWKAPPATLIEVHDATGAVTASGMTDKLGSILFRKVPPGDGYSVVAPMLSPPEVHKPIKVMSVDGSMPAQDFYAKQTLKQGFNYITTRDGTTLSAYVTFPGPADMGPYPTVVDYSGYDPSKPGAPISGAPMVLCKQLPVICDAPNDPSALIAAMNGYATVSVNMRGTGCSGGAYDYFEPLQLLDGYDVIETVAAQSWVEGHRVGMTGLSYPGITQLFVASTHPPSLAAITPLSVIGSTYTTGRPGGIFNDGFALNWITSVLDKADPYGQGWEQGMVDKGDTVCADNQLLHGQKANAIQEAMDHPYYEDALMKPLDPSAFVDQIDIPVFLAGAFEDEQTGPYFFNLLDKFKSSPLTRFTVYNGVHPDGFAPQILVEWKAFLDIYVAHKVPVIDPVVRTLAPQLFQQFYQVQIPMPPDRFATYPTWAAAKTAYEAEQPLRAIFEDGADPMYLGAPTGMFEMHFDAFPPAATTTTRFYFQTDGSMKGNAPNDSSAASSFTLDPDAGHRGILAPNGNVWDPLPAYDWQQPAPGSAAIFESTSLNGDLVMFGSASADLWVRSPVDDCDLQVSVTEVRPDGQERYIQSGWLRASLRALATDQTDLWPEHTYKQADEALLVPGQWNEARVGIPMFGHVFRKGSKIRVIINTPGGTRAAWTFANKPYSGTVTYDIGHDATHPSSIALPVLSGVSATTPLPACPSLRAEECRTYAAYTNVASP